MGLKQEEGIGFVKKSCGEENFGTRETKTSYFFVDSITNKPLVYASVILQSQQIGVATITIPVSGCNK